MLHFEELRVTQDNKFLIIDASVDKQACFNDVLIDSIVVDTQDTYIPNGPSNNPIYSFKTSDSSYALTYSLPEEQSCSPVLENQDKTYCLTSDSSQFKNVRLMVNLSELNISVDDTIFFVYVKSKGQPSPDTPEELKQDPIIGTVINLQSLYQKAIKYVRLVECSCEIPKEFIDMILRLKALELCIRTGNYPLAIKYWNKFFINKRHPYPTINC